MGSKTQACLRDADQIITEPGPAAVVTLGFTGLEFFTFSLHHNICVEQMFVSGKKHLTMSPDVESSCPPSGAIAGIVDQPMQNFQRSWEVQTSAGTKAKGVISGVGKGIVGVFTKPIGGAAELVSQTGYGEFRMMGDDV